MEENKVFDLFLKELPNDIKSAIDLGCGKGKIAYFLPDNIEVTGVDTKEPNSKNFDYFTKGDIENIEFNSNYDLFILSRVLHLLKDPKKMLEKVMKNTSEDKYNLIVSLDEYNPDSNRIIDNYKENGWNLEEHLYFLTPYASHKGKERPHRHKESLMLFRKLTN